ncbi:Ti-type conjugative transfer system protein TraG [Bartonella schoenbuchensis]|uniref:Type IV secretion system protein VirD4 n=1 Tax=Bartonella schoenbuchensis (strain DSM 13525 / NCTC 13165 / R1) TaxID=687861 RepID=A0A1S6XSG9_BARSR|nr:Ti-type conjugative transfer system protein TraG [Bartonella schoenbuchensis]AQX31516.1 type IV secretion system protein VirD4 [Bartonella schoenbuchensis R1]
MIDKLDSKQIILLICPIVFSIIIPFLVEITINKITENGTTPDAYWFIRSKPLDILILIAFSCSLFVLSQKRHIRKNITISSLIVFCLFATYYNASEYIRLSPYVGQNGMTWENVLPFFDRMVLVGSFIGIVILGFTMKLSLAPPSPLKNSKNMIFGGAQWIDMKRLENIFPSNGEIIIGERYRVDEDVVKDIPFNPTDKTTWGKGGSQPLLTYNLDFDSTHMLFFAGSGGYKTTSNVIPTCLKYSGPLVVFDPSTEIAPIVKETRQCLNNRTVYVLDPHGKSTQAFNPLDWLLNENIPLYEREAGLVEIARLLLSENHKSTSTDQFFTSHAHNLLTGLLAHIVFSNEYKLEEKNLKTLRVLVSEPEPSVIKKLRKLQSSSPSQFIRETLGVFTNMAEQTFSGVYATASKDTQWLSLSNYAQMISGDDFKTEDITKGNIDIFLNIPAKILKSYPGVGRILVGSFLKAMEAANGHYAKRVLFVLDEIDLLGYMNILEEARDRGRKYGISLMLFYQSVGQIERHFGDAGAMAWFESCAFVSYAAIKDIKTAKNISESCGKMTIEVKGKSKTLGTTGAKGTESTSFQQRPLIYPHEITQSMRKDEQIILVQGQPPIRCGRSIYFRRKDFKALANENRFALK